MATQTKKAADPANAIIYAPKTDTGAGILPLFFRAAMRALALAYVNFMKWPMTVEQAHAEISDAVTAYNKMTLTSGLMTERTMTWLTLYGDELKLLQGKLDEGRKADPDGSIEPYAEQIRSMLSTTLAVLSRMDSELFGLREDATDPGKLL